MNIPKLRFTEFIEGWKITKIKDHTLSSAFGPRFSSTLYNSNGNIATLRTTDMDIDGNLDLTNLPLAMLTIEKYKEHLLQKGDLVISRSGTIGITGIFNEFKLPVLPGAFLIRFRLDPKSIYSKFIQLYLNSTVGHTKLLNLSAGGVQKNLTGTNILELKLLFPTLPEQIKIATFLTAVDGKLTQLKEKKSLLEQYKKGMMQKIFSQEIRFKDKNGEDFGEWEEKKLGDCLDYLQPTKYLVSSTEYDKSFKTPVLTAGKTFILGYTNETEGIFKDNLPVIIFDDFTTATQFVEFSFKAKSSAMKILIANEDVNIKFMYEAMQIIDFEIGGHERHWISKFTQIELLIPSLPEQTQIANFLSAIDKKINHCGGQIEKMEGWKKGLLQKMFV